MYHRLYVPITTNGQGYRVIRLVVDEKNAVADINPKSVELYDVILKGKSATSFQTPSPKGSIHAHGDTHKISIEAMLHSVKDYYGVP